MICKKCNKQIPDNSVFCLYCGRKQVNDKPRTRKRPKGSGTIHKDSRNRDKPWVAHAPSTRYGKGRVYLGSFKTYRAAQDAIDKYIADGSPSLYGATLAKVYELWKSTHFKSVSQSAINLYQSMWKRFEPIQNMRIEDIRTAHLQAIIDKATSKSAAETLRTMSSMIFRYAMQNDIISKDYSEFCTIPKFDKKEKVIFTSEQISTLWDNHDDKGCQLTLFMIYTGLRIGELASLLPSNCKLDQGYIICGEKTDAGKNRVVPLPKAIPELTTFLKLWIAEGHETVTGLSVPEIRDNYFYPSLVSLGIVSATKVKYRWHFDTPDHITPHSCRHTFASLCSNAGIAPQKLQKIIGHARYETTANVYIHSDIDSLVSEMAKLFK